ncbi:MAG: endonuclease/exonuclease/phosphatase family protein [Rhodothermales bacterium]
MRRFFWALFVLLDGLVLLAAATGYAAVHVDPRTFWWSELLAVALPAFAVALLVLTAVPVAMKRWGWVALHVVALVVLALRLVPFERLQQAGPAADDDLVVMTLNVPRFGPSAEQLAADVFDLLVAERPVFVGLQETVARHRTQPPYRPTIASYVSPAVDSLGYLLAIPPDWVTHQPVLIRPDAPGGLVVVQQLQRTLETGPEDRGASQYVRTRFRWQGREGVHYNVHLRYFGQEKPWEEDVRLLQPGTWLPFVRRYREAYRRRAAEVEEIVREIEAETLPVIVAGDFNATANNWGYHRLAEGRTDAFAVAGSGWGGTYRADFPVVRIDHVLVDPAWEVVEAHVPAVTFSDHRPLVVRLRWRDGG